MGKNWGEEDEQSSPPPSGSPENTRIFSIEHTQANLTQPTILSWVQPEEMNGGSTDRPTDTATQEQVPNEITIRGRKISELMAKLSGKKHQTPQHAKNKTPSGKTKQTPTPSSVQKNKLTNYFMNKNKQEEEKETNEHKKKTTFRDISEKSVKQKIKKFQNSSGGEACVFSGGRCSTHNVKLERSVIVKKVGNMYSKEGIMRWSRREVTKLVCSGAQQMCSQPIMMPEFQSGEISNKKQRFEDGTEEPIRSQMTSNL